MPAPSTKPAESPLSRRKHLQLVALILTSGILWLSTLVLLMVMVYRSWGLFFHPETTNLQVFFALQEVLPHLLFALSVTIFFSGLTAIAYFVMAGAPLGIFGLRPKLAEEVKLKNGRQASLSQEVRTLAHREKEKKFRRKMEIDRHVKQFNAHLQGIAHDEDMPEKALKQLCHQLEASLGMVYTRASNHTYVLKGAFAAEITERTPLRITTGEGLSGEVARSGIARHLEDLPEGYMPMRSGFGKGSPRYLSILPLKDENQAIIALIELASFSSLQPYGGALIEKLSDTLASHMIQLPHALLDTPKDFSEETAL